jgi:hypothetical protein
VPDSLRHSERPPGAHKAVPPAPMPRDRRGSQVAPAPDGRGMPQQHQPHPAHRRRGFWIFVFALLALKGVGAHL